MALNEALQQLNGVSPSSPAAKEEWVATVTAMLGGIERCLSQDPQLLNTALRSAGLARLTSNLIQVRSSRCLLTLPLFIHCTQRLSPVI